MKRKEMKERLEAGEEPIDLCIQKWLDIADGSGLDQASGNCALCEVSRSDCGDCPLQEYYYGDGCAVGYCYYLRTDDPLVMLQELIQAKEYMIEDGSYGKK